MLFEELKRRNVIRVATAYIVTAWVIIQVAETVFPFFGFSDSVIRNVIIVLAIGFVPVVVLSWVFQLTPEGLRRDTGEQAAAPVATRTLDRAIIVLLVLGIGYFAVDKYLLAPERAVEREAEVARQAKSEAITGFYGDRSIAVLPFDNFSSDPEQAHFADGIAEEVLNLLARIRELRVISRSSAFAFRGKAIDIPEIAEQLNVAHVLEGSVRKMGNTVRVTVQLIEARTDTHLWSQTYTREFDNAFEIQDEIAADVTRNLHIKLTNPLPKSRYVDPEVISLNKQVRQLLEIRPKGVGGQTYELLSRALEIDPNYVPTLLLMTGADWFRREEGLITEEEMDQRYAEIYAKVEALDPGNGSLDAYSAFDTAIAGDLEEAAALYSRSLSKDMTDSNNIRLAGLFAQRIGKLDTSVRLLRHAVAIDPLCHQCRLRLAQALLYSGDYENARLEQERYLATASGGHDVYVQILLMEGRAEQALEHLASIEQPEDPHSRVHLMRLEVMIRHSLGDVVSAEKLLTDLIGIEVRDTRALSYFVAEAAAWTGKKDLAFERLFEMAPTNFTYLKRRLFSPIWRTLHDDPRWLEFRELAEVPPERLDAIEFEIDFPE